MHSAREHLATLDRAQVLTFRISNSAYAFLDRAADFHTLMLLTGLDGLADSEAGVVVDGVNLLLSHELLSQFHRVVGLVARHFNMRPPTPALDSD